MGLRPTARARRIAEPALFASIAALLHIGDLLMAAGMLGSLLCPVPHALSTLRHGFRHGALGALATVCVILILAGPVEFAYHLLLFVVPGLTAGLALRGEWSRARSTLVGTLGCALSMILVTYVLEAAIGMEDGLASMGTFCLPIFEASASPVRWISGGPPLLEFVPGLASAPARSGYFQDLLRLPLGLFLAFGFLIFYTTWFATTLFCMRLQIPVNSPPLPLGLRLPRPLALLFLLSLFQPASAPPWARTALANANFTLAVMAYAVGYLTLLQGARGTRFGGLVAFLMGIAFYYMAIWLGVLSALHPAPEGEAEIAALAPRGLLRR